MSKLTPTSFLLATLLAFATSSPAPAATQTFGFTGAEQSFVVPAGVTALTITARGASGGIGRYNVRDTSGSGGTTTATILVTAGESLSIRVGGQGVQGFNYAGNPPVPGMGGFNGGGNGSGNFSPEFPQGAGGGGGASDVRQGGTDLAHRVVVAGGGGGGGFNSYPEPAGNGGGLTGGSAGQFGGGGGSQSAGGAGGSTGGAAGSFGLGGAGENYGAGGGGGYYGGGGGGNNSGGGTGGGGGGSSYTIPSATNPSMTQGGRSGNGEIVLTWPDTTRTVSTDAELRAAILEVADNGTITFANDITLAGDLPAVQKSLTLDGAGHALNGASTYRGFFIAAWTPGTATFIPVAVTVKNLIFEGCKAQGGGGGSGGAGLGGAIFVAQGASLTLANVGIENGVAAGGSAFSDETENGGGGLGGIGGKSGGGGGGLGIGANGGSFDGGNSATYNGGAGIATGASPAAPGVAPSDYSGVTGSGGASGGGGGLGAAGSDRGAAGGGGGGGVGGSAGSIAGSTSTGGNGGFGGGGGAGVRGFGGNGGFGGGGGGGIAGGGDGGNGGFGGGGGSGFNNTGSGGFGGGGGGRSGGGGGLGAGGAIFVMQGGSLTLAGPLTISGNRVAAGTGIEEGTNGSAFGSGIFMQGNNSLTFSPGTHEVQTISGVIADQTGSGGTGGNAGVLNLVKTGPGILVLAPRQHRHFQCLFRHHDDQRGRALPRL